MDVLEKNIAHKNFIPWNRGWYTVKRHLPIIFKPFIASVVMLFIWKYGLQNYGVVLDKEAENPILFIIMPLVAFTYVIFISVAIESVFSEYKVISRCVLKGDLETFLLYRDEQLPITIHILIGVPALIMMVLSMMFNYHNFLIGAITIFSIVFVIILTWTITTELDDYERSIWFKEKIPKEWFKIDIEEFFKGKR